MPLNMHRNAEARETTKDMPSFRPLSGLELPRVHADSPVATIGGAFLVGAAALGSAAIVATAVIGAAVVLDDDEEESGPIVAPGTPPSQRRVGEQDLPAAVRGFIDRDMVASAASSGQSPSSDDRTASVELAYSLDGDIRNAPVTATRFAVKDHVILRLTIDDSEDSAPPTVTFSVDTLVLSTIDALETSGHVDIEFAARQGQEQLWRWSGHASQGKEPRISAPAASSQRITRQSRDLLVVRNLRIPVEYTAPPQGEKTVIEVVVSVEGVGARVK